MSCRSTGIVLSPTVKSSLSRVAKTWPVVNTVLPKVAGVVSGDKEAYEYLASSIAAFYEPEELLGMMRKAGFAEVSRRPLTFGIVSVYIGVK